MNPLIIGVDPGGRHTGIVLRSGDTLHAWELLDRPTDIPIDWYLGEVVDAVTRLKDRARTLALATLPDLFDAPAVLAVEDLNPPTPQMGLTSVTGLLETAQVIGALAGKYPILRIPPGGHGSKPLVTYPPRLVDPAERQGRGRLRHVRSAWDIAQAARLHHAAQQASQ